MIWLVIILAIAAAIGVRLHRQRVFAWLDGLPAQMKRLMRIDYYTGKKRRRNVPWNAAIQRYEVGYTEPELHNWVQVSVSHEHALWLVQAHRRKRPKPPTARFEWSPL